MRNFYLLLAFSVLSPMVNAQIRAKVVDVESKEPIPYANVVVNNSESLISNAEGYFTISDANSSDDAKIVISCMGYVGKQLTVGGLKSKDLVVALDFANYELDNVNLADRPTAASIMAAVKQNLKSNYALNTNLAKDVLFLRETTLFKPSKLNIEITKSTGFSKQSLKEANAEIGKFTSNIVSHPPKQFNDVLGNYYTSPKKDDKTTNYYSKLDVVQATKLQDESRSASLDEMQASATKMFLKHLDTTKYYRIKSGWFGSNDTLSLRKDFNKKKKAKPVNTNVTQAKTRFSSVKTETNFLYSQKLEFVTQAEIYKYTYEGSVVLSDGSYAYVLKFEPRKSRALYRGKIYVSDSDFAVLRADYELVPGKKVEGVNLKLLLGVKMAENVGSGTVIYKKDPLGDGYYLQYASQTTGQYVYLNRPIKFIELTDEDKDVVAFDLKIEGDMLDKREFVNMSRTEVSEGGFADVKEDDFAYKKIKKYDPSLWTKYGSIEPLEEMKRFQVEEAN
ncbi:carboxypeptidase-like regulatory domain-containing protein [Flavobacterium sp.]|uniref:carboxypeptidase-like regulatory domain-containing protein n=1 Tax=Flavobacterium sp. TaxID=239 RepID=UPI0025C4839C|nr:carboxypeptidase-like regulatory domain-containing protein [Flavobacterium sp.]